LAARNLAWLFECGIPPAGENVNLAPLYGAAISDPELLRRLEERRPRHVVPGLGGGTPERSGLYLKQHLSYKPAIHCVGAAMAFLSGDRVRIPGWVDKPGLDWVLRSLSDPLRHGPRYWEARRLAQPMTRCRDRLPYMVS
jgi:UDP-N-acetyl-D-mannosaminuronic acid transferase (WecB/TagA/CpsF family)